MTYHRPYPLIHIVEILTGHSAIITLTYPTAKCAFAKPPIEAGAPVAKAEDLIGYDRFVDAVDVIIDWEMEESHMACDLVERLLPVLCPHKFR